MAPRRFEQTLLGFDARTNSPGVDLPTQFLLRTDLEDVFSADTRLWPSIFETSASKTFAPAWIGMNTPFWEDLDALRQAAQHQSPVQLIAATWHTDVGF